MSDLALYGHDLFGHPIEAPSRGKVADDFYCPPFTVLSTREGWWQERKAAWIGYGIKSEVGRDCSSIRTDQRGSPGSFIQREQTGTSVFDPVLCELAYRWFCPPDGLVLDPFAGGSVRGIVASLLGRRYHGIELRAEQVAANQEQADAILGPDESIGVQTPCQAFGDWWAKREDAAGFVSVDRPSGSKVRAFGKMIAAAPPGTPLVVGCSADSLMQVYVADAARASGRSAHIIIPRRNVRCDLTAWSADAGATVDEIAPGYPSQYRAAARAWAGSNGGAVRWNPAISTADTADQVANIPVGARRVVVPCGSGAIAAGVLAGLALAGRQDVTVLAVAVSDLADSERVLALAGQHAGTAILSRLEWVRADGDYADQVQASLPDGTALDPAYAAKALPFVRPGDVLWVSGRRPGLPYVAPPSGRDDRPTWVCGDARDHLSAAPSADFLFTCPPYFDLERYSDDPLDLSAMDWPGFLSAYRAIIAVSVGRLKPDTFACVVIGDVRDKRGHYRNLPGETIRAFQDAGVALYNEAILVTPVGSLPIRVGSQFSKSRKFGKTHQNVLVFVKGDPVKAAARVPIDGKQAEGPLE
jgi:hypothetical protein